MAVQKSNAEETTKTLPGGGATFVKVSMDGAPYLRKVDLKMYTSYQQLSDALAKMFSSFTLGKLSNHLYLYTLHVIFLILPNHIHTQP